MPLQIIRNDITKVYADAIVNTANPKPTYGSGTDHAIYLAAGKEQLLKEREKIGNILPGHVAITSAFKLHAKYIIHTVGPVWEDGLHDEFHILKNCYFNSLKLAYEKKCKSIAFPLISTGTYGFPKDKALSIATSTITDFLLDHEMEVILVVFDKKAYQLSSKLQHIVEMIDDQYYIKQNRYEYSSINSRPRFRQRYQQNLSASRLIEEDYEECEDEIIEISSEPVAAKRSSLSEKLQTSHSSLEDFLKHKSPGFTDKLFELIDTRGLKDSTVYKRANMSKQTFSKIRNNPNYKPSKKSVFQLAISLQLSLQETEDLLSRAGYAFDPSDVGDLIIKYYIINQSYDIFEINEVLFDQGQDILYGAK